MLLENQLPFFVLVYLLTFNPVDPHANPSNYLSESARSFFWGMMPIPLQMNAIVRSHKHLLDVIRNALLPPVEERSSQNIQKLKLVPCAMKLQQFGIKFKKGEDFNLLGIQFSNGVLEIPPLKIQDVTEPLLPNLIAYEQCHIGYVMGFLNKLCVEVNLDYDFYFSELCEHVNKYCKKRWHRYCADLRRDYFYNPWAWISVVASLLERKLEDGEDEEALQIFFGKELWDSGAGLVAAALIAICPGYISRSVAGSYDNEGVAIFALLLTFYLFVKAVNTGSLAWSLASTFGYFYMVSACGGYVFIINLIPLYVLVLLITGRYSMRLYVAYNCMYVLGMLLAMQIQFVGFQHVQSGEHMAAMGVFFLLQSGKSNEVMELFNEMRDLGVKPTEATVVSLSSACGHLGALDQGASLHAYIIVTKFVDFFKKS
ncbi:hypothetical protein IFM89_026995 [Coptis chinensis]|uniref:dolichyl-diphosphooligosaccharide--protein glycotransferase n=1 Tax=Coptis chinensis TaxID=261450 RepID=A0A835I6M9_9MAGN|nr:hypothetical protein IFM89_026995 [Coptis chinensis]